MQALILAGGEGTRLRPLTETVPKTVLPLAGRPFTAYTIDWLERHGVDEVVLSCGYLAEGMRNALAGATGPALTFAVEPEPRGTAGAIKFCEEMLEERFVVLNGDVLADLDLSALIAQHEATGARATIALYPVEDVSGYGLVRRTEDGEITEFLEKPDPEHVDTDEINAGAYVLERSVLDLIAEDRSVSIERDTFQELVGNGLYGRRLEGYWMDIGTPERYLQATWDILEGRVRTRVERHPDAVYVAAGADVDPGATVGPRAVVAAGCTVAGGAEITESVLLGGCRVGEGARIRGSILSPGVDVGPGVELEGATVGADESVAA